MRTKSLLLFLVTVIVSATCLEGCALWYSKPYWRDRAPDNSAATGIAGIYYTATYVDPELPDTLPMLTEGVNIWSERLAHRFPEARQVWDIATDRLTVAVHYRCGSGKNPCPSEEAKGLKLIWFTASVFTLGIIPAWSAVGSTYVFVIHHNGKRFGPYTYELDYTEMSSIAVLFIPSRGTPFYRDEIDGIIRQFAADTKPLMQELLAKQAKP